MSGILDMVTQSLGPGVTQQLSQRLGTDPQQAQGAIATALPLLLAGLHHQASQPGGADALHAAAQQHDGSALDDPAATVTQAAGGAATAQVLGPHQAAVQSAIAGATGLNGAQAATLVAALSPLLMGAVGRLAQTGVGAGGLLQALQGEHAAQVQGQPGVMNLAASLFQQAQAGGVLGSLEKGLGGLFGGR